MSSETLQEATTSPAASPIVKSLRLWPALTLVPCLWVLQIWSVTGEFYLAKFLVGKLLGPMVVSAGVVIWWLFASRARWFDRWFAMAGLIVIGVATFLAADKSMRGMPLIVYVLPVLVTAWVGWLAISMPLPWSVRRVGLQVVFAAIGIVVGMLRLDGMDGSFTADFHWRWDPTGESLLLADLKQHKPVETAAVAEAITADAPAAIELQPGDWPGFRGPQRDGRLNGVRIVTDWQKSPPKELWRHRIGPGWSSFAAVGDRIYTQEQRGEEELVVCYDAVTGAEVWSHRETTRFAEVVSGPGPRATPTFHAGKIYSLGANGRLSCLNAVTGHVSWCADIVKDTDAKVPVWGFSSSPLVADGIVTVFAGGEEGKSVVAYQAETGECAWKAGTGKLSYCSPQLVQFDGANQVLMVSETGLTAFEPTTGNSLWFHDWPAKDIARVVQPAVLDSTDILIGTGMGVGTRRVSVRHDGESWTSEVKWETRDIKPYYNDFVVQDQALYGFDGNIFMCVGLKDGVRSWRTRGYGNGQVLLLADQKLLLILSETGEVALVEADPSGHHEIARIPAITGKTWNHPVVAHGRLFVRNSEEVAAFELKLLPSSEPAQDVPAEQPAATDSPSEASTEPK